MEFTSPSKYIKNTDTNGASLTEHLLNTIRGSWAPERTRKIPTQPGRTKERQKEKRKWDGTSAPGGGTEGEERFLHTGKPPHWWGNQLGQKGSFEGSEESTATSLWQAGHSKTYTDGLCYSPVRHSLRRVCWCGWVLGAGTWGLESRPKEGTAVGCEETA